MKKNNSNPKSKNLKKENLSNNKTWKVLISLIKDVGYKTNSVELVKKNR